MANILDYRALLLSAAILAPTIVATAVTGDAAWGSGGVIAISALIASERSGLAPVGLAVQGVAIVLGVALLLAVAAYPALSAASVAALAAGCFVITARGQRLRSLATFTFIPILYVGFEAREGLSGGIGTAMRSVAEVATLAILPVVVVATVRQHRGRAGDHPMLRATAWAVVRRLRRRVKGLPS